MAYNEKPPVANNTEETEFHSMALRNTLDAQGYSPRDIDNMMGESNPDRIPYPKPRPKPHRVSRRGGRSYPEEYEDPLTAQTPEKLSDEQAEINHRGADLARRALAAHSFERDVRDAKVNGIPLMALQRARAERAARNK